MGAACLVGGALGAGISGYLTLVGEVGSDGPFSYPSALSGFTGLQIGLALSQAGLILGLLSHGRTGSFPDTRRARVGLRTAIVVLAGIIVAEGVAISVPLSSLDATPPALGLVYAGYTLILGVALLAVGLELARGEARWKSRRWLLVVLGMWLIVPGLPALFLGHQAAGWVRTAWLLQFALLGVSLLTTADAAVPHDVASARVGSGAPVFAAVTWVYVAAFGGAGVPVAAYLIQNERLPSFFDIFDMYGGPAVDRLDTAIHVLVILAFCGVVLVAGWSAWLVLKGWRSGAVISVAVLPVEAAFWVAFVMPVPWLFGFARLALLAVAWPTLRWQPRQKHNTSDATAREEGRGHQEGRDSAPVRRGRVEGG